MESAICLAICNCSCGLEALLAGTTKPASANLCSMAKSTLARTMSAITTLAHPSRRAATAHRRPTAPAPMTVQLDPARMPARRHACTATARGSSRALLQSSSLEEVWKKVSQTFLGRDRMAVLTCASKWMGVPLSTGALLENVAMRSRCREIAAWSTDCSGQPSRGHTHCKPHLARRPLDRQLGDPGLQDQSPRSRRRTHGLSITVLAH